MRRNRSRYTFDKTIDYVFGGIMTTKDIADRLVALWREDQGPQRDHREGSQVRGTDRAGALDVRFRSSLLAARLPVPCNWTQQLQKQGRRFKAALPRMWYVKGVQRKYDVGEG